MTKSWAKSLLHHGKEKSPKLTLRILDIQNVVSLDEIPPALVINWDQTALQYVPTSSWTMEEEGVRRMEIARKDDKHQITAVLAGTMSGDFLPPQLQNMLLYPKGKLSKWLGCYLY